MSSWWNPDAIKNLLTVLLRIARALEAIEDSLRTEKQEENRHED